MIAAWEEYERTRRPTLDELVQSVQRRAQEEREAGDDAEQVLTGRDRLYAIWSGMKQRCENPKNESYARYGGRGIKVCYEWRSDFQAFHSWAHTHGYRPHLTLDRKNNYKGYSPTNCRWATQAEQGVNKRTTVFITINGQRLCASEWARRSGMRLGTILQRLRAGWPVDRLLLPPHSKRACDVHAKPVTPSGHEARPETRSDIEDTPTNQ